MPKCEVFCTFRNTEDIHFFCNLNNKLLQVLNIAYEYKYKYELPIRV